MKIKIHYILLLTCIAFTAAIHSTFAQDSSVTDFEAVDSERDRIENDRIINSPGEGDTRYVPRNPTSGQNTTSRDSVIARPGLPATSLKPKTEQPAKSEKPNQPKQDDDSILSFNFLYYIIQKYKLQDIID